MLAKISNIFEPAVAKAATPVPSMDDYDSGNTTQVKVKLTVYNASKVSGFASSSSIASTYASWWDQAEQDLVNDTRTLVIDEAHVDFFLANIVRSDEEKVSNPAITSIAKHAILRYNCFYDIYNNPDKVLESAALAYIAWKLLVLQNKADYLTDPVKFMYWFLVNTSVMKIKKDLQED